MTVNDWKMRVMMAQTTWGVVEIRFGEVYM